MTIANLTGWSYETEQDIRYCPSSVDVQLPGSSAACTCGGLQYLPCWQSPSHNLLTRFSRDSRDSDLCAASELGGSPEEEGKVHQLGMPVPKLKGFGRVGSALPRLIGTGLCGRVTAYALAYHPTSDERIDLLPCCA